jgi:hypothetical protein
MIELLINSSSDVSYVAIGCAMGSYETVDNTNNQQFPAPIANMSGSKTIILIDPNLEDPPVAARTHSQKFNYSGVDVYIVGNVTFICARFEYTYVLADLFDFVYWTITNKKKLIWQDYTGYDTMDIMLDIYKVIPDMLNFVLFDLSQNDCGCFIDFTNINVDFKQPRLKPLTPQSSLELFDSRVASLRHPLLWRLKTTKKLTREDMLSTKVRLLMIVYDAHTLDALTAALFQDICTYANINYKESTYPLLISNIETEHNTICAILKSMTDH